MLYLNKEDISSLIVYKDVIGIIENAMEIYESKDFVMPDRITVNNGEEETYLYMPCLTNNVKGTKVLTLNLGNNKINKPTLQGVMLLNNPISGEIECILDGATVTAYRTGAVGATGIKYTSKDTCKNLGIIGTGVQGFYQALYACAVRNIENIYVYDMDKNKASEFVINLETILQNINIQVSDSTIELVEKSEIIVTVTPSQKPVLPDNENLLRGKHFVGIGSYKPSMREYPESIYKLVDKVYIDVEFAIEESGDLTKPLEEGWLKKEDVETLYSGIVNKNINKNSTTFYKSVGMALFDVLVADYIYKKALEKNVGQNIKI